MAKAKGATIIADALARAMYDCPLHVLRTLNKKGFEHSSAMEIARRMVRELDHAGWRVKSAARREVMALEDGITFGLSWRIACGSLRRVQRGRRKHAIRRRAAYARR